MIQPPSTPTLTAPSSTLSTTTTTPIASKNNQSITINQYNHNHNQSIIPQQQQQHQLSSQSDALDTYLLDHALLQLLLPRVEQMWTYINIIPSSWSDSLHTTAAAAGTSTVADDGTITNAATGAIKRDLTLSVLRGIMLLCTIGSSGSTSGKTPAMTAFQMEIHPTSEQSSTRPSRGQHQPIPPNGGGDPQRRQQIHKYIFASALCPILYQLLLWTTTHHDNIHRRLTTHNLNEEQPQPQPPLAHEEDGWNPPHEVNDEEETKRRRRLAKRAIERRRIILRGLVQILSHIVPPLELYYHLTFILQSRRRRGRRGCGADGGSERRSPTFAMYWSGLNYVVGGVGGSSPRLFYDYAHRRVLVEEAIATAKLIVPFDSWRLMTGYFVRSCNRRRVRLTNRINSTMRQMLRLDVAGEGQRQSNRNTECPICYKTPICIPYITSCGHVYCYACLRRAVRDSSIFGGGANCYYKCNVCSCKVISSDRYYHDDDDDGTQQQ